MTENSVKKDESERVVSSKKDLAWIKKHYGEQMMHMCRSMFPQILEVPGELPKILEEHFAESRHLAEVIKNDGTEDQFKSIIFDFFDKRDGHKVKTEKSAIELMDEAGYVLYPECKTEKDIQAFKKYYAPNEELCTFNGGRLNTCRVWFAVKKNVFGIKRENFNNPKREDEYGTSVISIQFSKGETSTCSIKNRYNHTVSNPDNTFDSNLDNIISGLVNAFECDYGAVETIKKSANLDHFVFVDGKYYHYNNVINNVYYCDNNVIVDNGKVIQLDPFKEFLMDCFIVDFKNKTIRLFDNEIEDSFVNSLGKIKNIAKQGDMLTISVESGEDITIKLNSKNQMVSLNNPNLKNCEDKFLYWNRSLTGINLPKLKSCGDNFLTNNSSLIKLNLPELESCGRAFLYGHSSLTKLNLPKLKHCGRDFLFENVLLSELNLPKLESCDGGFLYSNRLLKTLDLPKLESCGNGFLSNNDYLTEVNLPKLKSCRSNFLSLNNTLKVLNLPRLESCECGFLGHNISLTELKLPRLESCGNDFLGWNSSLMELNLPKLESCGDCFLRRDTSLTDINLPRIENFGRHFLDFLCNKMKIGINNSDDILRLHKTLKNKYGDAPQSGE